VFTSWFSVFRRISLDVLDQFSQSFHHLKAHYVPMMDLDLILQFVKGRCHGNQIMLRCRNEGKLILRVFFAVRQMENGFVLQLLAIGGDTAAPSGLLARLCHAFLVK